MKLNRHLKRDITKNIYILCVLAHLKQKAKVRDAFLGYLWWFIEPLMLIILYSYIVVVIFGQDGENRIFMIAIGVTLWKWWRMSLSRGVSTFQRYKGIVSQIKMPLSILPISEVCGEVYLFTFAYVILQTTMIAFGHYPDIPALLLSFLISFFIINSLTILLAVLNTFIRDIEFIIGFALRIVFYLTPILYPISRVPEEYRFLVDLNPFAYMITFYNNAFIDTYLVDYQILILSLLFSLVLFYFSVVLCNKVSPKIVRNIY
ncbi:ABC-2 type transporter [Phocoenobacter uteri]|uniref:Transport permease protein n=1 Tax=Phocoenobacter uteri TaxID=146806 RepID=A0A379CB12_9PAST|nr:ABC transporter permease [Phocoenobacter uteri]SUB59434.1 ABC-2 type transporter [Phocoenobacter uteri]